MSTTDGSPPTSPTVTISPMRRRHVRAVVAIEAEVYPRPWAARLFEGELERGRPYLVARLGPTVVGYAGALLIADDAHVATLVVQPAWEGRQIATRLLVELVRQAVDRGAEQITLEVRMSNERAQRLYQRFGFVPAGARKRYYADTGEDALVMWAHEIATPDYQSRLDDISASLPFPTERHGFDVPVAAVAGARPAGAARPSHPAFDRPRSTGT